MTRKVRLAYLVSHPIQYQTPLLRRIAEERDIDLTVFFWSDRGANEYLDEGFGGAKIKWDIPLLQGYKYEMLPTFRSSGERSPTRPLARGLWRTLKRGSFDVLWVHGYSHINCLMAMACAKLLRIPVLQRTDSTLIDRKRSGAKRAIRSTFFKVLRKFTDGVTPVGTMNEDYWAHHLGSDFPSFRMPYAVDNAYFQAEAAAAGRFREDFRRQLGLEPGRPVILYASKLMDRKRCVDLIDAFLGMDAAPGGRKPYLLIVGDGTERAACEARVQASGSTSVQFLGFQNQSQLPRFYDLCDVFVLPSVFEPFALVINEVMNAGRAVVVSDEVGCHPDLIADGVNGRVFPAGNVPALRSVLQELIADPENLREMGRRSLDRINQWSFEEDIRGLRRALNHFAGLPIAGRGDGPLAGEIAGAAELRSQAV